MYNSEKHDILKLTVADVIKGQTDISYKGELQTLSKLSMRHQVCPSETCHGVRCKTEVKFENIVYGFHMNT